MVDTSIPAVPGAHEVVADVQSVRFWSRYQVGKLDGWRYVLFPDGAATVRQGSRGNLLAFGLHCRPTLCEIERPDGSVFVITAAGERADDAINASGGEALSVLLAHWVLATHITKNEPARMADSITSETSENDQTIADVRAKAASSVRPIVRPLLAKKTNDANIRDQNTVTKTPSFARSVSTRVKPAKVATPSLTKLERQTLVERLKLRCSVTGSVSLTVDTRNDGRGRPGKPRVSLGCGAKLSDRLSLRFSLVGYAISDHKRDWDPDFTYALTYRINDSISLGYSNYSGRFDSASGGALGALGSGNLRANVKLPKLELPTGRAIACNAGLGLPDPTEASASLSCSYSITDKLRIGATANLYFPSKQGEYDPDYTYTASYRISDDWLISYSNYSNNRWPWNRGKSPGPGLLGGSISVNYKLSF